MKYFVFRLIYTYIMTYNDNLYVQSLLYFKSL